MRKFYQLLGLFVILLTFNQAIGQVSGIKSIPGDYASIAAAVADLNTNGVGAGGVTINVASGHVESLTSTIVLTATGTSGNEIIFQKSGSGANPLLMAYAGTNLANAATQDGMFALDGSDFVTIDGINLTDTNTIALAMMEYGYGLFRASATNGCQNVTIKNCSITLNRNNFASGAGARVEGSVGIASLSSTRIATAAVSITDATGTNSNNKFYSNTIQNCNYGIFIVGFAASTPFTFGDTNNDIGGTSSATGNTITNYGGGTASSNPSAAIRSANQWGLNVSYNIINNNNGSGVNHPSTLRGIYLSAATSANANCNFNTVTVKGGGTTSAVYAIDVEFGSTAASNSINVNNNLVENCSYTTATSGTLFGIYTSSTAQIVNINNNIVRNSTINASTGTFYGINYNGATPNQYVLNNQVYGLTRSGAGTLYGIYSGSSTINEFINGNTVYDLTNTNTSATASVVRGIYQLTATGNKEFKNNIIYNLSIQSTNTTTSSIVEGLRVNYGTTDDISSNTIYGISGTGVLVAGIACAGTSTGCVYTIYKNKIYDIQTSNSSASTIISGITVAAQNSNIYNNLISGLNATAASATDAIRGINITGTTSSSSHNIYYNTIFLNASSTGANFGSTGVYHSTSATASTSALNLRNNIIINNSAYSGTGLAVAFRRSSTTLTNYSTTSNNNALYAGTPSAGNLIFYDGTNSDQTLAAFKTRMATRDQQSVSENITFQSIVGSNANFLKPSLTNATQIESGAVAIAGITDDFGTLGARASYPLSGQVNGGGDAPDMGAWEFDGTPLDLTVPGLSLTQLTNTGSFANRTINVTITDASGIATGTGAPKLYFRKNIAGTYMSVTASTVSGSVYTFTIDYSLVGGVSGGDTIQYYVAAQDDSPNNNLSSLPLGASGVNPPGSIAPSSFYFYQILPSLSGTYKVGVSNCGGTPDYATLTAAVADYNSKGMLGPVVFELTDTLYSISETFPIIISQNVDASAVNTLTIRPCTGVNTLITSALNSNMLIKEFGSYVTIDGSNSGGISRNLTISNTGTTAPQCLIVGSVNPTPITNVTVKNTVFINGLNTVSALTLGASTSTPSSGAAGYFNNITIQNINSQKTNHGIYAQAVVAAGNGSGLLITDNDFTTSGDNAIKQSGITVIGFDGATITNNSIANLDPVTSEVDKGIWLQSGTKNTVVSGNTISNLTLTTATSANGPIGILVTTASATSNVSITDNTISNISSVGIPTAAAQTTSGITITGASGGFTISGNKITNIKSTHATGYGAFGIHSASTSTTFGTIVNNFISDVAGTGNTTLARNGHGIYLANGDGYNVYFNSVLLNTSQTLAGGITAPITLAALTGTSVDIRNNIFSNMGTTGNRYAIYSSAANTVFSNIDYNNYYNLGTNLGFLGSNRLFLADLATGFGGNTNSYNIQPYFTSGSDLHLLPNNGFLDGKGTPIAGITTDIDGSTRNSTNPDLGADEFTPINCTSLTQNMITASIDTVCSGQVINFADNGIPAASNISYRWKVSNTSGSGYTTASTTDTLLNYTFVSSTTGTFYYILESTCLTNASTINSNEIAVTVHPLPVLEVTSSADSLCYPGPALTLTATGAATYQWLPAIGLDVTNTAIVNASPSVTTTYTVTGTSIFGCVNSTTETVKSYIRPITPVVSPTSASLCPNDSVLLTLNPPTTAALGNGTLTTTLSSTAAANFPNPFAHYYGGNKHQMLILASELTAIGMTGGANINSIAFNIASINRTDALLDFQVDMGHTSITSITGFQTGLTNVRPASTYTTSATVGASVIPFTNSFVWDGISNVIIQTSYSNADAPTSGNVTMTYGTTPFQSCIVYKADNTTSAAVLASTTVSHSLSQRPNIIFDYSYNYNYSWSPSTGLSNPTGQSTYSNPTSTIIYTITATSLLVGGCTSAETFVVEKEPFTGINITTTPNDTICIGSTVTLTANNIGGGAPFTYLWSPGGATTQSIDVSPSTSTTYVVSINDNCAGSYTDSVHIHVNPLPTSVAITASDTSVCYPTNSSILTASGALTYTWSPASGLSATTGTSVSASPSMPTTYTVSGSDANGCVNTSSVFINTRQGFTISTSSLDTSVCLNGSTQLNLTLPSPSVYCSAGATSTSFEKINNFTLNTINNSSTSTSGYEDFSSLSTTIATGIKMPFSISISGAYSDDEVYVWVDLNNDGVFQDPSEKIFTGDLTVLCPSCSNTNYTIVDSLIIPISALNGSTRMRIRLHDAVLTPNFTPCGTSQYGQVEDYSIIITNGVTKYTYNWNANAYLSATDVLNPMVNNLTSTAYFVANALSFEGCTATDTVKIIAAPYPTDTPTAINGDLICPGSTATLSATGLHTLNWYADTLGSPSLGTGSQFSTIALSTNTSYFVRDISSYGCEGPWAAAMVTMKDSVDISMDPQTTDFCELTSQSLSVTAAGTNLSYQWQKDGFDISGETSSTLNFASVALTDAGDYTVVVTSDCDVKTSAIATLTITPATIPDVLLSSSSTSVCGGAAITFTATPVNGGTSPTYQWYKNGQMVSGATNAIYNLNNPLENDSVYVEMTSNASPCLYNAVVNSSAVVLTNSTVIPEVSISTLSSTACIGSPMVFTSTASNTGSAPVYNWMINGNSVGASGSSFSTTVLQNGDVVSLMMTSNAACTSNPIANSNSITVTVTNSTAITTQPISSVNCAGTTATFTVAASGTGTLTYQWMKNGVAISSTTSATLILTNVSAADAGSYSVSVSGTCGTVMSNPASLTVNPLTVISNQPASATQCAGSVALFNVSASGTGTLTYQWKKGGVNITGAVSNVLVLNNITSADAGSYTVEVSGGCGIVTSSAATLTVNPLTAITTQPSSATQCAGTNATLTAAASGAGTLTYQWMKNGTAITGATSASLALNNLTAADAGSYMVMVTGTCGSVNSNSATVAVNALTAITTQPSAVTTCVGSNASLSVNATGSGTLTYQWKKGGVNVTGATSSSLTLNGISTADAGSYTVEVTGTCGTVTSSAAVVTVNALTTITAQPISLTQCAGTNANFSVTATGSGTLTYQWMKNGSAISGATSSALALTNISAADAAVYSVNITGTCGTSMSINATLNVNPLTVITAQPVSITQCAGTNAILSVGANGAGVLTYQWKKGGVNVAGAVGSSLLLNNLDATSAGSYTVEITGACGVVTSSAATITVNELTAISVQPVSASQCEGTDISMSVTASGSGTLTYQWRNNGIAIQGATNSSYTITGATLSNTGNYSVSVTGTCGTVNSNNAVVNINPLPVASFTNNAACEGSATMFMNTSTISSGFIAAYHWDLGNGTTTNSPNTSVVYDTAGTYMVHLIATSINGCTDTITEMVVVNALPTVTVTANLAVCRGEPATLTAGGADTYSWMPSNTLTSNTGAMVTATPNATTTYFVMGVDTNGCSNSASVTVTVNAYPVVDLGGDRNLCINNTTTLDAGNTGATYAWSTGATTQTISIDGAVLGLGFASFSVDVTANGCTTSDAISVFVDPCTSVDEKENATNVEVYPNPTRGNTTIRLSNVTDSKVSINIINSTGTIILTEQLEVMNGEFVKAIDFSRYAQGLYFLQVNSGNSNILKKIVVQ